MEFNLTVIILKLAKKHSKTLKSLTLNLNLYLYMLGNYATTLFEEKWILESYLKKRTLQCFLDVKQYLHKTTL